MPEGIEIEIYRRAADAAVGRTISEVVAPDDYFLKHTSAEELTAALTGAVVTSTGRRGKLMLLGIDGDHAALGLRFGMTGRLILDGAAPIDKLEYSSGRDDPAWDRFALRLDGGGLLRINDPRRLGGVELSPDLTTLGIDFLDATPARLRPQLDSTVALKARLLDQKRVAGIGNLIADETLWRAGLDPARPARSLSDAEVKKLSRVLRSTVKVLFKRGGSHTGDLQEQRHRDGRCPKDGALLDRRTIGGRTTFSCPHHQQ